MAKRAAGEASSVASDSDILLRDLSEGERERRLGDSSSR